MGANQGTHIGCLLMERQSQHTVPLCKLTLAGTDAGKADPKQEKDGPSLGTVHPSAGKADPAAARNSMGRGKKDNNELEATWIQPNRGNSFLTTLEGIASRDVCARWVHMRIDRVTTKNIKR
jgi:hypothetical protein